MKHRNSVCNPATILAGAAVVALALAGCASSVPTSSSAGSKEVGSVTDRSGSQVSEKRTQTTVRSGTNTDLSNPNRAGRT